VTGAIGKNLPSLESYGIIEVFKTDKINFHRPHAEICRQAEEALQRKTVEIGQYIKTNLKL